jgi:hypothetical protein
MLDVVLEAPVRGHRVQWLSTVPSLAAATDYEGLLIPAASSGPPVSVMFTTVDSMAKTAGSALTLLSVE